MTMMSLLLFTFRDFMFLWSRSISRFWFANCLLTYGRESKGGIFWKSDLLSFFFTLEATGRWLQWPKKLKNKSLWMIYSSTLRNEYCFVLKSQSCIPWKNLKYLRHFQELCCSVGLGLQCTKWCIQNPRTHLEPDIQIPRPRWVILGFIKNTLF